MLRSLDEIIDAAVVNTLIRLRNEEPKQRVVKRTGNKKALYQKARNKVIRYERWTKKIYSWF